MGYRCSMRRTNQHVASAAAIVLGTVGLVAFARWREKKRQATAAGHTAPSSSPSRWRT